MNGEFYRFDEITSALARQAEELAVRLFGEPVKRRAHTWEWRDGDRLHLTRRGRYRGWFKDWRSHRSYSPIGAAALALGMSYKDAAQWCAVEFLGWPDLSGRVFTDAEKAEHARRRAEAEREQKRRQTEAEAQQAAEEAARIETAMALWRRAVPIKGTPAEVYLRSRGIEAETWPETLRWHPSKRLLLALSTTPEGDETAVQEIHLDDTGKARKRENGSKIKLTNGVLRHGAVRFSGPADGPIVICEGIETAMTVHWATGFEAWAGLGLISGVSIEAVPHERTIIACPDDDARDAATIQAAKRAVRRWRGEGRKVLICTPFDTLQRGKGDHNDALLQHGKGYVAGRFAKVLQAHVARTAMVPVDEAGDELDAVIGTAMDRLADQALKAWLAGTTCEDTLQIGVRVDVGGGKTHVAVSAMVRAIKRLRQEMKEAVPAVVYAVPTHRLGAELEQRILAEAARQGTALTVRTWRGRDAVNPETGEKMCLNIDAVKRAQKALLKPQETVCRSKCGQCPHFASCEYQAQRREQADVWIVAHASLFHERPEAIGQPALVVVDEGLWQSSLRGFEQQATTVGIGNLLRDAKVLTEDVVGDLVRDPFGSAELHDTRRLLKVVLDKMEASKKEPLRVSALLDAGLTAEICRKAIALEWRRLNNSGLRPGMEGASFTRRATELAEAQGDINRLATMWRLLAEAIDGGADACGRVSFEEVKDTTGAVHEALVLRWTASIAEGWSAPVLLIDATLRPALVRHIFPRLEMAADINISTPHQRTTAVIGKSCSHLALSDPKQVMKLWAAIRLRAVMTKNETLVILPKAAEEIIRSAGPIPEHIHLLHHGATQGLDAFGKVGLLIVVGRTLPSPAVVSQMTAAITGQPTPDIGTADGWYATEMVTVAAADGNAVTLPRERHLPGLPEEIRAAICEDQLLQAIGRGRGVRRTEDSPLAVELWGDTVPPIPVDAFRLYAHPSKDEVAMAAGLWAESAADLASLYSSLGSENAIKTARKRTGSDTNNSFYGRMTPSSGEPSDVDEMTEMAQAFLRAAPHLRFAAYKKAGRGAKPKVAVWDARTCPDPRAVLTAAVGEELALWQELRWSSAPPPEPTEPPTDGIKRRGEATAPPHRPPPAPLHGAAKGVPRAVRGASVVLIGNGPDDVPLRLASGRALAIAPWELEDCLLPLKDGGGAWRSIPPVLFRRSNGGEMDVFMPGWSA